MELEKASVTIFSQQERATGRTNKKKFWMALASGFLFLGLLVSFLGVSGVAYAVPITGVGDFTVSFDKLEGNGYTFYPKLGENSQNKSIPMGRNEIKELTVYGLKITKELQVTDGQWVRITVTASKPVKITGLIQDARSLNGDATFNKMAIAEHFSDDWQKQFTQGADGIVLKNATLKTDYLFQNTVTLNGMKLSVERIKK
ncbi:DUF6230 family protein [Fictibacillus sp. Mic-4]|uniref:DUF6230 family protein n=1 Tax=Fictibacillus sp. Mic-4 TaxID=3132826 RepID=UPI003CF1415C